MTAAGESAERLSLQANGGTRYLVRTDIAAMLLVALLPVLLASRAIGIGIDDQPYLQYFANVPTLLELGITSPITFFFNEPLFLAYGAIFSDPEVALRVTIFLGALLAGIGVGRLSGWSLTALGLYFVSPLSLVLHVDHLRQGFAVGCYYFFFSCQGRIRWLRLLSPFVHSSFWIVIGMELLCHILFQRKRVLSTAWHLISLAAGIAISVAFAAAVFTIASSLGFRQAETYNFDQTEGSGLGLMFWIAVTPLILFAARNWLHAYFCMFLGLYLGGYFLNPLSARIFGDSYPLLYARGYPKPWGSVLALAILGFSLLLGFKTGAYSRLLL